MKRASDLADDISRLIEDNVWREGQLLPAERALCAQFGSARNTMRKALEQLAKESRIMRREKRGFVVRQRPKQPAIALPGDFMTDMSHASPSDIMELRLIVEPMAAALAAVRATLPDIALIARAAEAALASSTVAEREAADADFHAHLFSATRNPLLLSLCNAINAVREHEQWFERKREILTGERRAIYDGQHSAIVAAVRRRDANVASDAMRTHLETLRRDLLGPSAIS